MRVPLSWLNEYVTVTLGVDELAERLTMAGLEVSAIERIGVAGAELPWARDTVLIGAILEVRPHPNADRLVLADVDYGAATPHTVVTGAPNLLPYRGLGRLAEPPKSVFAREGAELYDGHAAGRVKVRLRGRPVRGVMSDAMLCSEKELGLSDDHEGILFLPADAPVGMPLVDYLGETVIEIDVLPNTARALSIVGVAREVAALTGAAFRPPLPAVTAAGAPVDGRARVTVERPDLCPRFSLTLVEGVTVGPAPFWMQRRLALAGMRPINNVVDISNYVMLELGQPSHTFDADRVADRHLIVRCADDGEQLTTLDGRTHALTPDRLLVCDPAGPLALAGVMGGASSEVSDSTTCLLVEAALWEPTTIRRTAAQLRLRSEASRRFERGIDPAAPPPAQCRLLELLVRYAGGTAAHGMIDLVAQPWQSPAITLTPTEVTRLLGITLTPAAIAGHLRPLGFGCTVGDDAVQVQVPSARHDVGLAADLCEEIARMVGFDHIPLTTLSDALPEQAANPALELEQRARDLLVGSGIDEAITYSLTSMAEVARIAPHQADAAGYLRLANPLSSEREYLRRSLLPTLLTALVQNMRERERTLLFEIGRVYLPRAGQTLPDEPRRLALALTGAREARSWHHAGDQALGFFDLKGIIEALLDRSNALGRARFVALRDDPRFHPGRAATLVLGEGADARVVGQFGEVHPAVAERVDASGSRILVAELELDAMIAAAAPTRYRTISRFPATTQDLAVIVAHDLPAEQVERTIRKYAGGMLESLTLFDVYQGPPLDAQQRSLAYRLAFRAPDRTLADADLASVRAKIIRGLAFDLQAAIRA
jgi:phenylalanyl-tRNA synthetase beta chain